jgi:hypothetical protein
MNDQISAKLHLKKMKSLKRQFNIDGNPLEDPPLEVLEEGDEAIREYLMKI